MQVSTGTLAGFKKICEYFLNGYPKGKQAGSRWIFLHIRL